jgi:hypothetical protein
VVVLLVEISCGAEAWAEPQHHRRSRPAKYEAGGHFAALQTPDLLATDIRDFFRSLRT